MCGLADMPLVLLRKRSRNTTTDVVPPALALRPPRAKVRINWASAAGNGGNYLACGPTVPLQSCQCLCACRGLVEVWLRFHTVTHMLFFKYHFRQE